MPRFSTRRAWQRITCTGAGSFAVMEEAGCAAATRFDGGFVAAGFALSSASK